MLSRSGNDLVEDGSERRLMLKEGCMAQEDGSSTESTGVLLVNTGSPAAPEPAAVKEYLARFLSDPYIRPMNAVGWWLILHLFILPKRSKVSAQKYAHIWTEEGSPLIVHQERLARDVEARLRANGHAALVRSAMNYGEPSVERALADLRAKGCASLVVLPLYPQSAYSTTASVHDRVRRALARAKWQVPCHLVEDYHDNSAYIKALAAAVRDAGFDPASTDELYLSYHSIPLADVDRGDAYPQQVRATNAALTAELGIGADRWRTGFQCRFDKEREWLTPFTRDVLAELAHRKDAQRLFFLCPNFAIDCLETLYDIGYEIAPAYRVQRKAAGLPPAEFVYVPCLNSSPAHSAVLASILAPHLP